MEKISYPRSSRTDMQNKINSCRYSHNVQRHRLYTLIPTFCCIYFQTLQEGKTVARAK